MTVGDGISVEVRSAGMEYIYKFFPVEIPSFELSLLNLHILEYYDSF